MIDCEPSVTYFKPRGIPVTELEKISLAMDEFEALRPLIRGAGNIERFDYWLNTFLYMRSMTHLECAWAEFNSALGEVKAETDRTKKADLINRKAVPGYHALSERVDEVYGYLLQTVSTNGELGTVMNWEQHCQPELIRLLQNGVKHTHRLWILPDMGGWNYVDYPGPARGSDAHQLPRLELVGNKVEMDHVSGKRLSQGRSRNGKQWRH